MKVRFTKYCPWSYRLTKGKLIKHLADSTADVAEIEGNAMIAAEYAVQVKPGRPPVEKKIVAPEETKIVTPKEKKVFRRKKGDKK